MPDKDVWKCYTFRAYEMKLVKCVSCMLAKGNKANFVIDLSARFATILMDHEVTNECDTKCKHQNEMDPEVCLDYFCQINKIETHHELLVSPSIDPLDGTCLLLHYTTMNREDYVRCIQSDFQTNRDPHITPSFSSLVDRSEYKLTVTLDFVPKKYQH